MSRRLLIGALLAGLVVFLWSGVSHMLLPWWNTTTRGFNNEEALGAALMAGAEGDGIYILPDPNAVMDDEAAHEAAMERTKRGPVAFVALTSGGMDPASPRAFILQIIFDILAALLLARLISCLGPQAFSVRLRMVVVIAVIAGLMIHLPNWAWYGFGGSFTAVAMIDLAVGWFLGGLVLARFAE